MGTGLIDGAFDRPRLAEVSERHMTLAEREREIEKR